MRVLMCDDSAVMRRVIRGILESEPGLEVVGVARNGKECVDLACSLEPDLITLDIEMPVMDGLTALRQIMSRCPTTVLMISSLTIEGSRESLRALQMGAADVVAKDHANFTANAGDLSEQILARVRALADSPRPASMRRARLAGKDPVASATAPPANLRRAAVPAVAGKVKLTVIGASTGGPPVVERVLSGVPPETENAIVVAQHMPPVFTKSMAGHLNDVLSVPVVHLDPGVSVEPGRIHIAPGGLNTHIRARAGSRYTVRIDREPACTVYFPSATELFLSAASVAGAEAFGIMLTGMGTDGEDGVRALVKAGGTVVAQREDSCVVYGMPKAAVDARATPLHPDDIRMLLTRVCSSSAAAA